MRKAGLLVVAAALTIMWLVFTVHAETTAAPAAVSAAAGKKAGGTKIEPGMYLVRAIWREAPLPKVRVEWRHRVEDATPALSGNTIRFGTASFRPASGLYYLTADWRADGDFTRPRKAGDRFAWLGGNPLLVSSEIGGEITMVLEEVPPVPAARKAATGVSGRVTLGGRPAADVGVYAYGKTESGLKGDDFQAVVRTDVKGEFAIDLPAGRYYLVARLRNDNSIDLGPLHKGDLLGYDPRNPVVVEEGRRASSVIPVDRLKMLRSPGESREFPPGILEGRIVDRDGRPVPGVYAALYGDGKMTGRPLFRSEPVGADGRFRLSVPVPGNYFLGAKTGYGSEDVAAGWSGAWAGSADHSIPVRTGVTRSEVEITVERRSQ